MANLKITTIKLHIPSLILAIISVTSFIIINFYINIDNSNINLSIFSSNAGRVKVIEVVNENTIKLEDNSEIRIIGIGNFSDKEIHEKDRVISELKQKLLNKNIYLEDGVDSNSNYKNVWLIGNFKDTTQNLQTNNIAGILLNEGLCKYSEENSIHNKNLYIVYLFAKNSKKGIWN